MQLTRDPFPEFTNSAGASILNKTTNDPTQNWAEKPKQTFLHGKHTDGQEAHEKMLNTDR